MLLAIALLGGSNATKVMLNANTQASDIYSVYQSKIFYKITVGT
jgi:hypothetical protein